MRRPAAQQLSGGSRGGSRAGGERWGTGAPAVRARAGADLSSAPIFRRTFSKTSLSCAQQEATTCSFERERYQVGPNDAKLAHAFLWEYSYKRLKLAQLLGQLGVLLTLVFSPLEMRFMSSSISFRSVGLERSMASCIWS